VECSVTGDTELMPRWLDVLLSAFWTIAILVAIILFSTARDVFWLQCLGWLLLCLSAGTVATQVIVQRRSSRQN
jgi:hypothetical protein